LRLGGGMVCVLGGGGVEQKPAPPRGEAIGSRSGSRARTLRLLQRLRWLGRWFWLRSGQGRASLGAEPGEP
jgi:hypothetical protein